MGRKLEQVIFNEIADICRVKYNRLFASYIATAKNKPVEELYERLGFTVISQDNGKNSTGLKCQSIKRKVLMLISQICFNDQ